jgi:hypothetical protein
MTDLQVFRFDHRAEVLTEALEDRSSLHDIRVMR